MYNSHPYTLTTRTKQLQVLRTIWQHNMYTIMHDYPRGILTLSSPADCMTAQQNCIKALHWRGIVSYSNTDATHDPAVYLFSVLNPEGLRLSGAAWTCYLSLHLLPTYIQEYIYVGAHACIYSTYKSENVNVKRSLGCQSTKPCFSKLMYNSVLRVRAFSETAPFEGHANWGVINEELLNRNTTAAVATISHLRRKRQHRGKVAEKRHF